jgi:DUF1680 family protein
MPARLSFLVLAACALAVAGELTARFDLTLKRVLHGGPPQYTEPFLLADVVPHDTRRFTNFSGDLSGRYLGALAISRPRRDEAGAPLEGFISAILEHQKSDGHFGDPMGRLAIEDDDMARLWGNGRLLIGLLEYYRETPRPEVLQAARALGDFLIAVAPRFNDAAVERAYSQRKFAVGYVCWTQNIEGLVALSRESKDRRYLELAARMAERTLFNEFFANQFESGDFGHYKIAQSGIGFGGARA